MSDPAGVVLARDDGLIDVPGAVPITRGLIDVIEHLVGALGIPARDEHDQREEQD